jgi:ABC-2 type transport system permease protein
MLRRDRIKLPAWAGGIGLFGVYVATAIPAVYEEDISGVVGMFADPIGRLLTGPGYGFDDPTVERLVGGGYGLYFLLAAALMSILSVTRHTRVEEQSGRAELVRASVVGRHTNLVATLVVALITNVAAGAAMFAALAGVGGFAPTGSALLAASVALVGLAFAAVTTITVQLTEYSRAAAGLAGGVLGAAFVLRAGGDMAAEGGTLLSWLSPLGWGQQTAPYVLDRWWPLALLVALAVVATAWGFALSVRRDLGASLFAVRPGAPRAHPSLGTPWGLAIRLQRASLIGWTAAMSVAGLLYGGFADAMRGAIDDMPDVFVDLFGADDLLAGYLGYMAMFQALLVSVYAILAVQSLWSEETDGRGEPLLATPVSRTTWLGTSLGVVAVGVVVILVATGAATGVGALLVTGDWSLLSDLTAAHAAFVPAPLVVLGLATLLFGVAPRAIPATWAVVVYGLVTGTFGVLLDLPQMANNLSPFEHLPQMPLEPFALLPVLLLLAVAAATALVGFIGFGRREINVA